MIFLTVGTQFPFDRLVRAVDALSPNGLMQEKIYAQIGDSEYVPAHFEAIPSLEKSVFDETVRNASAIISHAGMGSINLALEYNKPLLVMPRRARFKEVVNDHQVGIARKFADAGHLLLAMDETDLPDKIRQLKTFTPRPRENLADQVAARIRRFLETGQ